LELGRNYSDAQEAAEVADGLESGKGPAVFGLCAEYQASHHPDDLLRCRTARLGGDLPEGHLIRYYGLLGNRYRKQKLARCRKLLGMSAPESALEAAKDYHQRYEELTGSSLWECPVCHQGRMLVTQILPRSPHREMAIPDTSACLAHWPTPQCP
jgi:hypothetical protein